MIDFIENGISPSTDTRYYKVEKYNEAATEGISSAVSSILAHLGEDTSREGIRQTPMRVAKALQFCTQGYQTDPKKMLEGALFDEHPAITSAMHAISTNASKRLNLLTSMLSPLNSFLSSSEPGKPSSVDSSIISGLPGRTPIPCGRTRCPSRPRWPHRIPHQARARGCRSHTPLRSVHRYRSRYRSSVR